MEGQLQENGENLGTRSQIGPRSFAASFKGARRNGEPTPDSETQSHRHGGNWL